LRCQSLAEIAGAGEENRTPVISLEGCCSTIELHPRIREHSSDANGWARYPDFPTLISDDICNPLLVEGVGFEPT
jgi:hypothetical protein